MANQRGLCSYEVAPNSEGDLSPASVNANYHDKKSNQYREADNFQPPAGVYSLSAHGNQYAIRFKDNLLNAKQVANSLLNDPRYKYQPGTPVVVYACSTGCGTDNFASRLANELNVVVTAPNNLLWWVEKSNGSVSYKIGPSDYNDSNGVAIRGPDGKYHMTEGPEWKMIDFQPQKK